MLQFVGGDLVDLLSCRRGKVELPGIVDVEVGQARIGANPVTCGTNPVHNNPSTLRTAIRQTRCTNTNKGAAPRLDPWPGN